MSHILKFPKRPSGKCPKCGQTDISFREIQAVTYKYDLRHQRYLPVEFVSPEEVDYEVVYDDDHPEVTAICPACGHEWEADFTDGDEAESP
jgi:DNA-directed RNA polymerase subunit M/transcription elongation factor TFIIS